MIRYRTGTIALILAAGWLAAAQVGKVPPALPVLVNDLSLSMVQAGSVASAITSITAVLGILSGLLVAIIGGAFGLSTGLALLCLGSFAGAFADSAAVMLASRLLEGMGFVLIVVTAPSLLAMELAGDAVRRRRFLVVWGTYMPIGIALMMGIAPLILAWQGWRALWSWNAGLAGALLVVCVLRRQHWPAHRGVAIGAAALKQSLALPGPWLMGLCFGCYTAIWFMLVTWLPSFAVSEMGFSLYAAAWLTAAAVLFNILGNLSAQYFPALGVSRWMVLAGVQVIIGGFGWVVFSSGFSPGLRSVAALLACGLAGALPATVFAGMPFHARKPDQIAVGNGIIMQCSSIGSFAGPPAIALVVTTLGGWDAGRWLLPAVAAVGFAAALALRTVEQKIAWQDVAPSSGRLG